MPYLLLSPMEKRLSTVISPILSAAAPDFLTSHSRESVVQ